jgi:NAD-specific glutamate dehydrogenase
MVLARLTAEEFDTYRILDQIQSRASRLNNMRFYINEVLHGIQQRQSDDLLAPTTAQIDAFMAQYRATKSASESADRDFFNMRESLAYYRWLGSGNAKFSGRTPDVAVGS